MHSKAQFDEIAENYDREMPRHIREHLCAKKTSFMIRKLKDRAPAAALGLDCGCGTGWHVKKLCGEGCTVYGIDYSEKMIGQAKKNNKDNRARFTVSSADKTPFKDRTYDFVYFINVLHHMGDLDVQQNALREAHRLLKPGGTLFISEVNEDSFLFMLYIKYIFPLTNKIHGCGREEKYWKIREILAFTKDDWSLLDIEYFTFLPNIIPAFAFPIFKNIEMLLEKCAKYKFGAHWLMTLKKRE